MSVKSIFICSDNTDHFFKTTTDSLLFGTFEGAENGASEPEQYDFHFSGASLLELKSRVQARLEEKVTTLGKGKDPSHTITVSGKRIKIDLRDKDHSYVHSLSSLLYVIEEEEKMQGALRIYDLSGIDNFSSYLLMFLKAQTGLSLQDYYSGFFGSYPQFNASYTEFSERIEHLLQLGFVREEVSESGMLYAPAYKTTRIYF